MNVRPRATRRGTTLIIGRWPSRWSTRSLLLSDNTSGASGCSRGETRLLSPPPLLDVDPRPVPGPPSSGRTGTHRAQCERLDHSSDEDRGVLPVVDGDTSDAHCLYRIVIPSDVQSIPDEQDIGSTDSQPADDFLQAVRFVDSFAGHVDGRRASVAHFKSGQSLGGVRAEFFFLVAARVPRGFALHRRRLT